MADSSYARKRRSGNMMYGPAPDLGPKFPEWRLTKRCLCAHQEHISKGWTYAECELNRAQSAGRMRLEEYSALTQEF